MILSLKTSKKCCAKMMQTFQKDESFKFQILSSKDFCDAFPKRFLSLKGSYAISVTVSST